MKTLTRARLSSSFVFLPVLVGVATLASACAATTGGADVGPEQVSEAIAAQPPGNDPGLPPGKPPPHCAGQTPLPPKACNTVFCDGLDYLYQPIYNAVACTTDSGARGTCATDAQAGNCFQTITGTITPKYYVLTVEYAPPGASSSVDYGVSSTSTTSTSTSDSFENTETVSASASLKDDPTLGGEISVSYAHTVGGTVKGSIEVKATRSVDETINGFGDGVDHGLDRIYLRLSPTLNVTTFGSDVSWSFAPSSAAPIYVTPDWLLNRTPMPVAVLRDLQNAGITPDDYAELLSVDPFANATPSVDTKRYVLQAKLPYEPLTAEGSKPTQAVYSTSDQQTISSGVEAKTSTKVTVSESASLFKVLSFKNENTLTWTYGNASSLSTASQISAKATIVQPGVGYAGGLAVDVYLDTIFNTLLFVVEPPPRKWRFPPFGPFLPAQSFLPAQP